MNRYTIAPVALFTLFAALGTLAATPAAAQDGFQLDTLDPLPSQGTNLIHLGKTEVLGHLKPSAGLFLHFQDDPLQLVDESTDEVRARIVDHQLRAEVLAGIGFLDMFDLGIAIPIVLSQSGEGSNIAGVGSFDGLAMSDIRLIPKWRILHNDKFSGFGLALLAPVYLPTGDQDTFNSDGSVRAEPRLAADFTSDLFTVVANLGVQFRPEGTTRNYVNGNSLTYGLGAEVPVFTRTSVIANWYGSVGLQDGRNPENLAEAASNSKARPMELLGGLQFDLPADLIAQVGAGTGLNSSVGSPDLRLFASIGYTPRAEDRDGDGIADNVDSCPDVPEDKDGFEDRDGCLDEDNDQDGILDHADACPNEPEDMDVWEDTDGCPDNDNDKDGIHDEVDQCRDLAGVEANQGCPLVDTDGDGLYDSDDQCPNDPEDKDGFEDENGCPDPDNDKDGVLDANDKCPLEKEVINGVDDEDGCPDEGESKVRVTDKKIEILEKVYFDSNKDTIQKRSYNVLNQVASILKANAQITKIQIEGHTDSRGRDSYNLDLSKRRAAAVKTYLAQRGIEETRLESDGYGETKPVADNNTKAGREENRRVEFNIVEIDGKAVDGTTTVESN